MKVLGNIFEGLGEARQNETIESLLQTNSFRLERIVSTGHTTPEGEWYDQTGPEWVVLLTGNAKILFEDPSESVELKPGDFLNIPAHCRHRVEWTDPAEDTVWLALHYTP